jgi:exopolysaccharide biosynthesis polyprenyl glycosylphosphotransferase
MVRAGPGGTDPPPCYGAAAGLRAGGRMTDKTIDVGAIRPVAAAWTPEGVSFRSRVSRPGSGADVFGFPAPAPVPPVAMVGLELSPERIGPSAPVTAPSALLARRARLILRDRRIVLCVVLECCVAATACLAVMGLFDAFGAAPWTALAGALCVVARSRSQLEVTGPQDAWPLLRGLVVAFAGAALLPALGLTSDSQLTCVAVLLVAAGGVVACALLLARHLRRPARVVVVGDREAISRAAMRWSDGSAHVIGGVLATEENDHLQAVVGVPTIAGLGRAVGWALERHADLVIVAPVPGLGRGQVRELAWALAGSGVRMAVGDVLDDVSPHRIRAERLGRTTLVGFRTPGHSPLTRVAKAGIDRVLGAVLLVLAAPFLGLMMLAIRLDSPGPALFRQVRVGQDGRLFTMYKLRTMHDDAEQLMPTLRYRNDGAGLLFKLYDDPRATRVGRILRRTSMDELPQLCNVLKGQMSLVGPRPALPCEVEQYDDVERRRIHLKPGMTGLWQVSGRSNLDWETSVALDLDYVDNGRLCDDVLIGLRTVGAVVRSRGAY